MSSVYDGHGAANCIDDSTNSFCHSTPDTAWPWLSIQLPSLSIVSHVALTNRVPNQDLLSPFQLWVGASAGDYNSATSASCGVDEVNLTVTTDSGGPFSYRCADSGGNPLSGEYLTLVLPGSSRTLHITEIRAY